MCMKKVVSLVLTMALLLTAVVVGTVTASAQSYDTAIKVGSTTYVADVGDTFTYTVSIKSDRPLSTGQLELPVDFAILSGDSEANLNEYIEETMPIVGDTGLVKRFDTANLWGLKGYVFNFATAGSYDFSASKVAFTLRFKVLKAGSVTLDPALGEFIDANGNDMIDYEGKVVAGNIETSVAVSLAKDNKYSVKAPQITSFGNYANGLRVNWKAVDGAGKYRVFKLVDGRWKTLATVATTYYLDTTAVSGAEHTYTVRAMDAQGKSFVSDYSNAGWTSVFVGQPAITGFDSQTAGLKVTWGKVAGAAGYRVYRKNGSKWATLEDVESNTYIDTDVEPGTAYTYTVRCLNVKGALVSAYNTTGWTSYYLGAPVMTSAASVYGGVTVKWQKMTGAEKYRVFRKTEDTGWYKIGDTTAVTYTDKVVDSDITYYYTARCITADGKKYTSPYDTEGVSVHYLAAPVISKMENVAKGTTLTWSPVAGVHNYRVFMKNGGWKKVADTTDTSYTVTGLTAGTAYSFTVRGISEDGSSFVTPYNGTGWKNTFLSAPVLSSVANANGGVAVKWAAVKGAAKYRIFRKTTGGWAKLADTTAVGYTDKTAKSGTTYSYTVRCISANGKAFTSAYDTKGKSVHYIAAPVLRSVAKVSGGVKFTFNKSAGAAKYRIFRKTGNGSWQKLADTTSNTYTDKTVKSGTKYAYTARCITANGRTFTSAYNTRGLAITYKR